MTMKNWILVAGLVLAGCGGGSEAPPEQTTEQPTRWWYFNELRQGTDSWGRALPFFVEGQSGGVGQRKDFGAQFASIPSSLGNPARAEAEIYSSSDGKTYWTWAEGPHGEDGLIGASSGLTQTQTYMKLMPDAKLQLVISSAFIEALDFNGDIIRSRECQWEKGEGGEDACLQALLGSLSMSIDVFPVRPGPFQLEDYYFNRYSKVQLKGYSGNWERSTPVVEAVAKVIGPVWSDADFAFEPDVRGDGSRAHARLVLKAPKTVEIDLSKVPLLQEFGVSVAIVSTAVNRRGRESHVAAYLRDPQSGSGLGQVEHVTSGLQPTNRDVDLPVPASGPSAVSCASGPDPAAGQIAFSADRYAVPEWAGAVSPIVVTRSGGNRGAVSVRFEASGGSAIPGTDYTPLSGHIVFGDGDSEPREIQLQILSDAVAEPDKTLQLTLSEPGGCATLGARSTVELRILDDDRPPPTPTLYSVGGNLTGLVGGSVLLREVRSGSELTLAANGSFGFDRPQASGQSYDVRVVSQPTSPIQVCNVRSGSGTVSTGNVTDVSVACTPQAPTGSGLDPSFGTAGKVTAALSGGGRAVGLQRDGRIVVLGPTGLMRFHGDGALDASFGNGGTAAVDFEGTILGEEAQTMVVQSDDRIVVAGLTRLSSTDQRMAVSRFNADGSVDTGFGRGGTVSIDPYASVPGKRSLRSTAQRLLIQRDGKIVVAGSASFVDSQGMGSAIAFAVARLNVDGSLDTGFGGDGASTVRVGGEVDIAYALVQQSDGKLVLAGRAGDNVTVEIGLARLTTDGSLDTARDPLDRTPDHYGRDGSGVVVFGLGGPWLEASEAVILGDDSIVVAVLGQAGQYFQFTLMRFSSDGEMLGSANMVQTPIGPGSDYGRALTLQADGKLVVAGSLSGAASSDFGIVRYNADLTLDTAFGQGGVLRVDFFQANDEATDILVQRDGRLLVVGSVRNGSNVGLGLLRVLP